MKKSVSPSKIEGKISAPPSKSYAQRAIAVALLANGRSRLWNPSQCKDAFAALSMAESLGATVEANPEFVDIDGGLNLKNPNLNCGESGLSMRMFSPIAALFDKEITMNGEGTGLTVTVTSAASVVSQVPSNLT